MKRFGAVLMLAVLLLMSAWAQAEVVTIYDETPVVADTLEFNVIEQDWDFTFSFTIGDSLDTLAVHIDISTDGGSTWTNRLNYTYTTSMTWSRKLYFDGWQADKARFRVTVSDGDSTGSALEMTGTYDVDLTERFYRQVLPFTGSLNNSTDTLSFNDVYRKLVVRNLDSADSVYVTVGSISLGMKVLAGQEVEIPVLGIRSPIYMKTGATAATPYSILLFR